MVELGLGWGFDNFRHLPIPTKTFPYYDFSSLFLKRLFLLVHFPTSDIDPCVAMQARILLNPPKIISRMVWSTVVKIVNQLG